MKTILQAFEWYLPSDSQHWNNIKEKVLLQSLKIKYKVYNPSCS
ncbi:hypothetical protein [Lactococcus garvieae]|nr:hypothetical protein [Lactococcus garvieae]